MPFTGCWVGSHDACSNKNRCMETRREPNVQLLFCCCEGSMCNRKMVVPSSIFSPTPAGLFYFILINKITLIKFYKQCGFWIALFLHSKFKKNSINKKEKIDKSFKWKVWLF